jgi:hypothetical protein
MKKAILAVMICLCATALFAQKAPADKLTIEKDIPSLSRGFPATITSVPAVTADGYQIEVKTPFQSIKGRPGPKIGFDLQVNDDPGSGRRETIATWNDPTNESFKNTAGFGTLILK